MLNLNWRVGECSHYLERQRFPLVCFGVDEYAETVMTECLYKNLIWEPSITEEALIGYSDANWAGDHDNCHSTTGNLFLMSEGAISCLSKKTTKCNTVIHRGRTHGTYYGYSKSIVVDKLEPNMLKILLNILSSTSQNI